MPPGQTHICSNTCVVSLSLCVCVCSVVTYSRRISFPIPVPPLNVKPHLLSNQDLPYVTLNDATPPTSPLPQQPQQPPSNHNSYNVPSDTEGRGKLATQFGAMQGGTHTPTTTTTRERHHKLCSCV